MQKLIYDVGMHKGEDTDFYLKKGFDVVGVEADPTLVLGLRERFADEIRTGRLKIVAKAINDKAGSARFAVNPNITVWGTLDDNFATRNASQGAGHEFIDVECVTFDAVLAEHGVPYYLKIDIEGREMLCLEALARVSERPEHLSIESRASSPGFGVRDTLEEIRTLKALGYTRFQYVDQSSVPGSHHHGTGEGNAVAHTFPVESSGAFGADLEGDWHGYRSTMMRGAALRWIDDACGHSGRLYGHRGMWRFRNLRLRLTGMRDHWYDLHAARG